jgi:hypothetical protein
MDGKNTKHDNWLWKFIKSKLLVTCSNYRTANMSTFVYNIETTAFCNKDNHASTANIGSLYGNYFKNKVPTARTSTRAAWGNKDL